MNKPFAAGIILFALSSPLGAEPVPVNPDNFVRAESDLYFGNTVGAGGFGAFDHTREPAPLDKQTVIRLNRDTIYSAAVFDLDAGPATITMPDVGERYMSMQIIDQDHYTHAIVHAPGPFTLTRDAVGTRYVIIRTRPSSIRAIPKTWRPRTRFRTRSGSSRPQPAASRRPNGARPARTVSARRC